MCGIVGAMAFKNSNFKITEEYLCRMRDVMAHRGPDGAGVWVASNAKVGLGHRRLSIIDLSEKASQPMCNEDASLWISFNGEIYNHADIRDELKKIGGHVWKTDHSDTEMILHAFEQWGIDCIHKFRGMFAIALWDVRKKELCLIRDRIGIKPLYYSVHHGRITFASEIKALLQDPDQKRAVNEEAFYHYLSFLTVPSPRTLFEGVEKLPNGTWLRIREDGQIDSYRYWDVLDHTLSLKGASEGDIADMIRAELRTAVQLRKISDVPVGVFLSGGIDSSLNAALFSEKSNSQVKTFTIGYEGENESAPDETRYARIMAGQVGAKYHEKILNIDDLINILPQMVRLQDEPIADPICVPVYYLCKLARDNNVTVCQVGEGADELFCGYPDWMTWLKLQNYDDLPVPNLLKSLGLAGLRFFGKEYTGYYERLRRGANDQPVFWGGAEVFTEAIKKRLLSPRLRKHFSNLTSWEALKGIRQRFDEKSANRSNLNWMTYLDLNFRLPELLLMRVDKMSMGVSLECRVPFLDHKVVELAMSIPQEVKIRNDNLKHILKRAARGLIPDEFIDRKKQSFGIPLYEWYFDRLWDKTCHEIRDFCDRSDFLSRPDVENMMKDRGSNSWSLWNLLNFSLWWKEYIHV